MKHLVEKYWKLTLSLLFALGVVLFWAFPYMSALSYQEQYQLFLFDGSYFTERIGVPGGLADYVAEFLTQFYYVYVVGAIFIALLFFGLQRSTWQLMRRSGSTTQYYPLSFLPTILLWAYMGNENVLLSFVVALFGVQLLSLLYLSISTYQHDKWSLPLFLLITIPATYWLLGAVVWVYVAFVALHLLLSARRYILGVGAVVLALAIVGACSTFLPYPYHKIFGGINYFRYPGLIPWMQWVVMAAFALLPFVSSLLRSAKGHNALLLGAAQVIALAAFGFFFIRYSFNPVTYEMIQYDYLVRTHQWNKIISKAERKPATTPLSVSSVNLALAMTDQLDDRLFEFYQNGAEGLFPTFTRDMTSPLPTSEVFYQLGMINDAERYTFEAQEAIPNYRKSGRMMQRLVQTNIINGHYKVAEKYLHMLQKSLFYRSWANDQMRFIGNDKAVNADKEYGRLRDLRIKHTDYLFSDQEMDQMLGMLLVDNKKYNNRMAYEYLVAYELLQRDVTRFMQYYPLGKYFQFDHIPYAIQQVLIGSWLQTHQSLQGMPYSVDQQNVQSTIQFIQTYMADPSSPALSEPPLCYNAWHYLMLGKNAKKKGKEKMKNIY